VMARLGRVLSIFALLIASCARPDVAGTGNSPRLVFEEAPWSFRNPSGWHASTWRSDPAPNLKTGVLSTHLTNVAYSFGPASPGPNSNAGASEKLGPSAAVVKVLLLWYPPDEPIRWDPTGSSLTGGGRRLAGADRSVARARSRLDRPGGLGFARADHHPPTGGQRT
jgi:hypothetical protein